MAKFVREQTQTHFQDRRHTMKRILWTALMIFGIGCVGSAAQADGWAVCSGCHNGMMAPNKDSLAAKYKTTEELIKGAQASENPMMAKMKEDTEVLKAAAAAIGLSAGNKTE
jgi:hypothetical protein